MIVFQVSLTPFLECRVGLIGAFYLEFELIKAMAIIVFGDVAVIPPILIFVKKMFVHLKKLGARAIDKSHELAKGEFIGLLLFVGVPLQGTSPIREP